MIPIILGAIGLGVFMFFALSMVGEVSNMAVYGAGLIVLMVVLAFLFIGNR